MTIRQAEPKDAEYIAKYLMLAMEEIVYKFIGENDYRKAKEFLLHFIRTANNQYSYQNCLVAEDEHTVVAAVNVYDGAKLAELRKPIAEYIAAQYNKDFNPEDETQSGEYYIDSLGVDPSQQGKGVGSKMLQLLIDEYVTQKRQTLGLLVEEGNPSAKKLYFRLGFKPVGTKLLVGKSMEHLQLKG